MCVCVCVCVLCIIYDYMQWVCPDKASQNNEFTFMDQQFPDAEKGFL